MKHDSLQYKTSFYAASCTVEENDQVMKLGYIFVDMIKISEIVVQSGTGESYKLQIPESMMNLPSAHQFNYALQIIT